MVPENFSVFPIGNKNDAYAQYFIGQSYLCPLTTEGVFIGNVTFEPGCRNNWHIHHAKAGGGQILLCTAGRGWYQEWGKPSPGNCTPATPSSSRRGSSTGTGRQRTAGSPIWRSRSPARRRPTNGWSRSTTNSTGSWIDRLKVVGYFS